MKHLTTMLVAIALASPAAAQPASFTPYGNGCSSGGPPPLIQALTLPQIGGAMTVRYVSLPAGQTPVSIDWPALVLGLQQTNTPVPPLSPFQPANCTILASPDVIDLMAWLGTSYENQRTIPIPNDATLAGFPFQLQFLDIYFRCQPTCNLQIIRTTNAGTAVIGF